MAKPIDDSLTVLLLDALAGAGAVTARRMFGGIGIFSDAKMFGLVYDDTLYFKADDTTVDDYDAADSVQFMPRVKGRAMSMPYYTVPAEVIDNPEALKVWAERAIALARSAGK